MAKFNLPPFPELLASKKKTIYILADIAALLHLVAFIVTLVMGLLENPLWLAASILIGCLMVMIPFVTDAMLNDN